MAPRPDAEVSRDGRDVRTEDAGTGTARRIWRPGGVSRRESQVAELPLASLVQVGEGGSAGEEGTFAKLVDSLHLALQMKSAATPGQSDLGDVTRLHRRLSAPPAPPLAADEFHPDGAAAASEARPTPPSLLAGAVEAGRPEEGLLRPAPPGGAGSWDWPLSRHESKARVLLLDRLLQMADREELLGKLEELEGAAQQTPKPSRAAPAPPGRSPPATCRGGA